jgi:hypothetical protein
VPKRKSANSLSAAKLTHFRTLLDSFINKPSNNPDTEHKNAEMDMTLMIRGEGFVAWHQHFLAELETWLVNNAGSQFVPCPIGTRRN